MSHSKDIKRKLRASLDAEQTRTTKRFRRSEKIHRPDGQSQALHTDADSKISFKNSESRSQLDDLIIRYSRIGYQLDDESVLRLGIAALDQMPGPDLRILVKHSGESGKKTDQ